MTSFECWWRKWPKLSPTSYTCHKHISSPTSVTIIEVFLRIENLLILLLVWVVRSVKSGSLSNDLLNSLKTHMRSYTFRQSVPVKSVPNIFGEQDETLRSMCDESWNWNLCLTGLHRITLVQCYRLIEVWLTFFIVIWLSCKWVTRSTNLFILDMRWKSKVLCLSIRSRHIRVIAWMLFNVFESGLKWTVQRKRSGWSPKSGRSWAKLSGLLGQIWGTFAQMFIWMTLHFQPFGHSTLTTDRPLGPSTFDLTIENNPEWGLFNWFFVVLHFSLFNYHFYF